MESIGVELAGILGGRYASAEGGVWRVIPIPSPLGPGGTS